MPTYTLSRSETPLIADVVMDDITAEALAPFDLDPSEVTKFYPWEMPAELPPADDYSVGLIVGASGSGKSQLLTSFGTPAAPEWAPRTTLVSHFPSATEASERFYAVGLNTVPVWRLPYNVLSNGQKFRADLARMIGTGAVVDEFTSVVDRNVAASASKALRTYLNRTQITGMVLAACHRDIIPWLRPDWVIDTDAGTFTVGEVEDAPKWYAEHLTGLAVGRLTLASAPPEAPAPVVAPVVAEALVDTDAILDEINSSASYADLRRVYLTHMSEWTPEHTAAASARRAQVSA